MTEPSQHPQNAYLGELHAVERMTGRRLRKWEVKMLVALWDDIVSR